MQARPGVNETKRTPSRLIAPHFESSTTCSGYLRAGRSKMMQAFREKEGSRLGQGSTNGAKNLGITNANGCICYANNGHPNQVMETECAWKLFIRSRSDLQPLSVVRSLRL